MVIDNFVLKTGIFSVALISFHYSFAFLRNEKISSPLGIDDGFIIAEIRTGRVSLLIIFMGKEKRNRLILLLFGKDDISGHYG